MLVSASGDRGTDGTGSLHRPIAHVLHPGPARFFGRRGELRLWHQQCGTDRRRRNHGLAARAAIFLGEGVQRRQGAGRRDLVKYTAQVGVDVTAAQIPPGGQSGR